MNGKPLTPGELQEPTEYEKVIEGLAKVLELDFLMSIDVDIVGISSAKDFQLLFSKHWTEFKHKAPLATQNQFKTVQKDKIQNVLNDILTKIPSFKEDNRYLYAERYINEYLSQEAENKREISKEPHAMVKAWVIHFQFKLLNKELKDIEAIDKCLLAFKWSGSKERLRQLLVEVRSISNSDGKNGNPSEKQIRDLGSAIKYMNNNEAIAKAKERYSKLIIMP